MKHTPSFYLAAALLTLFTTSTLRAVAPSLYITNGTSTNFTSGTNSYVASYVGSTNGVRDGNNLTVVNTNTVLTNSGALYVGYFGASNSMVISNGGKVQNTSATIGG